MSSADEIIITASVVDGQNNKDNIYVVGDWLLNANTNQLTQKNTSIELEYRLTKLLIYFLQNRNKILKREDILKAIWENKVVNDDSIAVAISHLRKALDDNPRAPKYIKTIPGVGYQFILPDGDQAQSFPNTLETNSAPAKQNISIFRKPYLLMLGLSVMFMGGLAFSYLQPTAKPIEKVVAHTDTNEFDRAVTLLSSTKVEDLRQAVILFRKSIENSLGGGRAYWGLAEAKMRLLGDKAFDDDNYAELTALLYKSLALDPKVAEAHILLANLVFKHDLDVAGADTHYKLGLSLNPNNTWGHYSYARFLFIQKRFDEAREEINASRNLNPLSYSETSLIWLYLIQGNNELAAREMERIESTEGGDFFFKSAAQNVYYSVGDEKKNYENMQWFFRHAQFSEEKIAILNHEFSVGGIPSVNKWLLDHKETADLGQYTPPMSWARYAIASGQKQQALEYLEQAFKKKQPHVECAVADPRFAPLFDDARFKQLISKFTVPAKKN